MAYRDLRDFIAQLEAAGDLKRVRAPVDPKLEMTALCDRALQAHGPALLFEQPKGDVRGPSGATIPVLGNLFGTPERVAKAMGADPVNWQASLRDVGRLLAFLKEPEPPKSLVDAWRNTRPVFMKVLDMAPKERSSGPCQDVVWDGDDVDLARLPIQTCWPGDAGPLITWGLTVTRGPHKKRQNLGIYRQQVIARNKVIMRWLGTRGGALDFRDHALESPGTPFPIAVALGADPATILGAVTPVPDTLSEYQFAGLLRGGRTEIVKCITHDAAGSGERGDRARGRHSPGRQGSERIRDGARRPVRRPHRLLQRSRALPGVHDRADHAAPRSDLSLDLHRQAARRARDAGRRTERSVRAAAAEASIRRSPISTCRPKAAATVSRSSR